MKPREPRTIQRGRPVKGQKAQTLRITVTLDAETITRLRDLGDGNLSAGIRIAASQVKHTPS